MRASEFIPGHISKVVKEEHQFSDYELAIMEGGNSLEQITRRSALREAVSIVEAFDQPYKILRWETGDFGDIDAIARLDDNTFLSIMFNKGVSKDSKEEAWSVEFYRNNSQEVTGEGDAQRVFATVISAMQTFIKKYKPNRITFTASKEVEQGQNAQSRARLYDSLVQRYARSWGFRAFRADTGNKVIYELNRINKDVTEGKDFDRCFDQACKLYDRAVSKNLEPKLVQVADFQGDGNGADPRWMKLPQHVWQHYVVIVGDQVLDPTAKQFGDSMPTQYQVSDLDRLWGKQYQIRPRQGMAENFADGKNPEHKGDSKRHGIPKHATLSQLDKISHEGGRRGQLAHWQANMRRGRAKNESEILDDLEEGWKDWVAGAALGAAALSPQAADAKASPQQKPAITQQVQGDANYATKLILKPEAKILIQTARAAGMRGKELAQFVAQCAHETANFSSLKELGGRLDFKKYDPKHNPRKAKMLGNKQVGDGAKYHGRGYIQLTGRDNYKRAGQSLGLPLEAQPELVERPEVAAKVAVWFWQNQVAPKVTNFNDTAQVTKPINSGLKGLDDRHNKFASIMALMGSKS